MKIGKYEVTRIHTSLIVAGVLGLLALVLLPLFAKGDTWWGGVLLAVGQASVVAAVLGLTVTPLATRAATVSAIDTAMHDAASYVLTYGLPEEAPDAINYISECKLIRCDFTLKYRFQKCDEDGKLIVRPQLSYRMANYTPAEQPFEFELQVTGGSAKYGGPELVWARGDDLSNTIKEREFEENPFTETFMIPANKDNPQNMFIVRTVHRMPENHEDVFFFLEPTLGATVVLEVEDDLKLVTDVSIGTFYRDRVNRPPEDESFPLEWTLDDTLLLPGQAISVEWERIQA